jgi:hypothetical protein
MPRLVVGFSLIIHTLTRVQSSVCQMLPQLLKTSIIVIPDVAVGLSKPFRDFRKGVSFEKVQAECLLLIFG